MNIYTGDIRTGCCQGQKKHAAETVHHEQLVLEVLELMLERQQFTFLVYKDGLCIDTVCFEQLTRFLVHQEHGVNLFFHKLNFTLESALYRLANMDPPNALVR